VEEICERAVVETATESFLFHDEASTSHPSYRCLMHQQDAGVGNRRLGHHCNGTTAAAAIAGRALAMH